MKLLYAILIASIGTSAIAQDSGYGYLYQYDVNMTTEMQWDVAPEALEVGTARGGAGAWVAPLSQLGNWEDMDDSYQANFDDKIMEHAEMKDFNDKAAFNDVATSNVLMDAKSTQFTNMLGFVGEMAESSLGGGGNDFIITGEWIEETAGAHMQENYCFNIHIEKLAEYMPEGMKTGFPSEPYLVDFSDGWRRTFYDIVKTCMSFLHCLTALGFGIKCIRWTFA